MVYGVTGPTLGTFTVTLDGSVVATLSAHTDIDAHGVVLFFTTNLNTATSHTLLLTAVGDDNNTGLVIDSFIAYGQAGGVAFT